MAERTDQSFTISLPLYGAAFAAALCGILTVADTVDDASFTQQTLALTCAGFAFSLGCRALRISTRLIEWLGLGIIALVVGGAMSGRVSWGGLIPPSASQGDVRLAVILCWAAVLLSWTLLHDGTTLFTPVLSIAMIGLSSSFDLNNYVEAYFVVLLIATIFLLAHFHGLRLRAGAGTQEPDRPTARQIPGQLALAAACSLAVVALGVLLVTPVEALAHNLSFAGAIRRLASITQGQQPGANAFHFSDDADFAIGTGDGWSASSVVLAKVTPSDGQPHLWRGRTYDHYSGNGWQSTLSDQRRMMSPEMPGADGTQIYIIPPPAAFAPGRPVLLAAFDLLGDTSEFYYAPGLRRLTLPAPLGAAPRYCEDGQLDLDDERPLVQFHYVEMSLIAPDPLNLAVQSHLRDAGRDYPAFIKTHYLGNMSEGPNGTLNPAAMAYFRGVVAQCLAQLPGDRRTPIDMALALRAWVSDHCIYSLHVQPIPANDDHVYDFLAKTQRGYCDMYASSLAVLCRIAGIPARVATGFAPGVADGDAYDLRALDRHAWTEVYFPGSGWLAFDATMGTRADGSIPTSKAAAAWSWPSLVRHLGWLPLLVGSLILVLLGYVAVNEWNVRRRARREGNPPVLARHEDEASRRYARMTRALAPLGLARKPAETPSEFAARAAARLSSYAPDGPEPAFVGVLTEDLNQTQYGGSPPADDPERQRRLQAFVASARRLRQRLLVARLWPQTRPVPRETDTRWN